MTQIEQLIDEFGENGVETTFHVGARVYRAFAYPSRGRFGSRVRWNLYEAGTDDALRGLTFGFAGDARQAIEDLLHAAQRHASGKSPEPSLRRQLTFRPSPHD